MPALASSTEGGGRRETDQADQERAGAADAVGDPAAQ
jgi:hypothetical protein